MSLTFRELQQLHEHAAAGQALSTWIAGAEAVALLIGAVESGIIHALRTVNAPQQIAVAYLNLISKLSNLVFCS